MKKIIYTYIIHIYKDTHTYTHTHTHTHRYMDTKLNHCRTLETNRTSGINYPSIQSVNQFFKRDGVILKCSPLRLERAGLYL